MPATKKDSLTKILRDLKKIGDISGSVIVSTDGLTIASDMGADIDDDTVAAMAAAMQGAAETAVSELRQGELRQIIVDADHGKIISISAGSNAILVILASEEINLGLALLELGKAAGKISTIVGD